MSLKCYSGTGSGDDCGGCRWSVAVNPCDKAGQTCVARYARLHLGIGPVRSLEAVQGTIEAWDDSVVGVCLDLRSQGVLRSKWATRVSVILGLPRQAVVGTIRTLTKQHRI